MDFELKAQIVRKYGSQANFAQAIKMDETLVSRVINGRRVLKPEDREKWARALGKSEKDLFAEK